MKKKRKHITALNILKHSGFEPKPSLIEFAKKSNYFIIEDIVIDGDAPKDFISYYHYGEGRRSNHRKWPKFIAKFGHKYYPMESITEQLLTRIGEVLGFNMAQSKLSHLGGQIRFLSKYFKKESDILDHGADLYAGYLQDKDFVEDIEKHNQSHEFFDIDFTKTVIKYFYPDEHQNILNGFFDLLFFDAIVGNNDRHFYNWGIIHSDKKSAIFSPIYDTARGLFWNSTEESLLKQYKNKNIKQYIEKYSNNSRPKIGIGDNSRINHFELIEYIKNDISKDTVSRVFNSKRLNKLYDIIDRDFNGMFSSIRKEMINEVLKYRIGKLQYILKIEGEN